MSPKDISKLFLNVHVYARTSPAQKDYIIRMINKLGKYTAMCGDGTNDVGSLKSATIGIAVLNGKKAQPKKEEDKKSEENKKEEDKEEKLTSMFYWPTPEDYQKMSMEEIRKKQTEHMQKYMRQNRKKGMNFNDLALMDSHVTELGDACMAAPFTYKFSSVGCMNTVICQGRTTITTTYQMYRILAVNSMISAYAMSTLYLDGVKNGDVQMTMLGMAMGVLFMLLSLSKPLDHLSTLRPHNSIFSPSIVISVLFQFVFHFICLLYIVSVTDQYIIRDESTKPDTDFKPNLKNNVVFVYSWVMTATTFLVNYEGEPYMQSLKNNSKLYKGIMGMYLIALVAVLDMFDWVRDSLELVPFPNSTVQTQVIVALALDTVLCIVWCEAVKKFSRKTKLME